MDKISDLKEIVITTLDLNKAEDIVTIDLKDKSSMADYMIIASGTSSRHLQSLSEILVAELKKLGRMKIYRNDVLVLEIDNYGILKKKEFYNKDDMKNIKIVEATTQAGFKKNSFIYEFMSSMRQKINDPLGVRAKKRKEISQR